MKKKTLFVFLIIAIVFVGLYALLEFTGLIAEFVFIPQNPSGYAFNIVTDIIALGMCAVVLVALCFALKYVIKNSAEPAETPEERRQRKIQAKKEKLQKQLDELEKQ